MLRQSLSLAASAKTGALHGKKETRQACKERPFSLLQPSLGNVLEPPKEQTVGKKSVHFVEF